LGIKELLPPFLSSDLELKDLLTGVAFACGGSGYDPLTSKLAVIIYICTYFCFFFKSRSYINIEVVIFIVSENKINCYYAERCKSMQTTLSSDDQLELFHEYKQKLTALVGEKEMTRVISEGVFFTVMGSNDIVNNYFTLPIRRHEYDLPSYVDFLVSSAINFTKVIIVIIILIFLIISPHFIYLIFIKLLSQY